MEIETFLPRYPNTHKYDENLLNLYGEDFYESIFRKKEFYENKLDPVEEIPKDPGSLMRSQKIISRFLSSRTLYDSLLLVWQMGTGKTCSAVGAIEQIKSENSSIKGAIILVKGPALRNLFIQQLLERCTGPEENSPEGFGRYIPYNYYDDMATEIEKRREIRKLIGGWYKIYGYQEFTNTLGGSAERLAVEGRPGKPGKPAMTDDAIKEKWSNHIIVIDEIHNIRLKKDNEARKSYAQLHRFLHVIENKKVLLMSGTPMKDDVHEIADIMNLMLPLNNQFAPGFNNKFLIKNPDDTYSVNPMNEAELKSKFKGHVSYLRSMVSPVQKVFEGEKLGTLEKFIVFPDEMSDFQTENYAEAYAKDKTRQGRREDGREEQSVGWWNNSVQASLLVFPDGSWGKEGFNKYIETREGAGGQTVILMKDPLKKFLNCRTRRRNRILPKVRELSSKYERVIRSILDTVGQCSFVFSNLVSGSGIIVFAKILECFGFKEASGQENAPGLRYGLLIGEGSTPASRKAIIDRFNKPDNIHGEYIQVILGSIVAGEGFTIMHVQNTHILTPHWNYSQTEQAIFRTYRLTTHEDLIEASENPEDIKLRIYQHVSLPSVSEEVGSIDLMRYEVSEKKDMGIKRMEQVLKESAVDCPLTYARNRSYSIGFEDGSRECNYGDCDYVCDGMEDVPDVIGPRELDYSTYDLYYSKEDVSEITTRIKELFRTQFAMPLNNLLKYFEEYTPFEIISSLRKIIDDSVVIMNKYGFKSYLREQHNIYFLVGGMAVSPNWLSSYYSQNPDIDARVSFRDLLEEVRMRSLPGLVRRIQANPERRGELFEKLPLQIRETYIEGAILGNIENRPQGQELRQWVLNHNRAYIHRFEEQQTWMSSLLFEEDPKGTGRLKCLRDGQREWRNCEEEFRQLYEQRRSEEEQRLEQTPHRFYGIKELSTGFFRIRDMRTDEEFEREEGYRRKVKRETKEGKEDKRSKTRGKKCKPSYTVPEALKLIDRLEVPLPEGEDDFCDAFTTKAELIKYLSGPYEDERSEETKKGKKAWQILNKTYKAQTQSKIDEWDREKLCRMIYWSQKVRNVLCAALEKWFRDNDWLLEVGTV